MQELSVAGMGLMSTDIRMLSRLTRLALANGSAPCIYTVAQSIEDAHIMIVNKDDELSLESWELHMQQQPETRVIFASSEPPADSTTEQLRLPLRVLPVLDSLEKIALSKSENRDADAGSLTLDVPDINDPTTALTALVVDDSLPVRQSLAFDLEEIGFEVDTFETGEQALEAARQSSSGHSLVFLDVVLPGIDGYEVCRELRQEKDYKQVPIVILTGKSSSFDKVSGSLAGCDDYLMKPVEKQQLEALAKKHTAYTMTERDSF